MHTIKSHFPAIGSSFGVLALRSLACFALAQPSLAGPRLNEVAIPSVRPAGCPDYADVCMRYGWVRSTSFPTVQDAKDAIANFHATRVDWFYPGPHNTRLGATYVTEESRAFINWCHANDMKIGGAMNPFTSVLEWKAPSSLDPFPGVYVGDPANQAYVAEAIAWGKAQIDAGLDTIVCDGFPKHNSSQRQAFSDNVIAAIKAHKPGFAIAGNDGRFLGTNYVVPYAFDFHYSDTNFIPSPSQWWNASKEHRAQQSAFLSHPNREMTTAQRRGLIALSYGAGAHLIAPWDEWLSGDLPRLFADPADFADLYGFARSLGQRGYLNGYEDAAVGGYDLAENRYGASPPIAVIGGSGFLSVFGRAKPGEPEAPLVFHLVESGTAQASTLRLQLPALFNTSKLACRLYTPPAYMKATHEIAQSSGDFLPLAKMTTLPPTLDGHELIISLPPINPWSVLELAPSADSPQITAGWKLDGDALDSHGNHHGSLRGGAVYSADRKQGSHSVELDGIDDYVDIPDHSDLDIGTGNFSFALWFKRDANAATNLRLISKGGQDNADPGYAVWGSDTSVVAILCNGKERKFISGTHKGAGTWNHLAVTIDRGTDVMILYVNGSKASETDISDWLGQDLSSIHNLRLGRSSKSFIGWDGRIDDVRVYQSVLSPGDVSNLITPRYNSWISYDVFDPADQSGTADPDGDGIGNALEAFFGTNAGVSNPGLTGASKAGNIVSFQHPNPDTPLNDVTGSYEWSTGLDTWYATNGVQGDGTTTVTTVATPNSPAANVTTVVATISGTVPPRIFLRAVATAP